MPRSFPALSTPALSRQCYSQAWRKLLVICFVGSLQACISFDPLPPIERQPDGRVDNSDGAVWPPDPEESEAANGDSKPDGSADDERVAIATPESVLRVPERSNNSATAQLRRQARTASAAGNQNQAIRLLERALRISSREPETYYEFANVRLKQERRAEALQLARKGLSLRPELSLRNDLQQIVQLSSQ